MLTSKRWLSTFSDVQSEIPQGYILGPLKIVNVICTLMIRNIICKKPVVLTTEILFNALKISLIKYGNKNQRLIVEKD